MKLVGQLRSAIRPSGSLRYVVLQALAQLIPLAAAPVITRLYSSEAYGALGIFGAISAVGMALATGRYQRATLVADDSEILNTTRIGLSLATIISAVILLLLVVTYPLWNDSRFLSPLGVWTFFIPVSIWLISAFDCFLHYHLREGQLGRLNRASLTTSIVNAGGTIGLGVQDYGASGTITGTLLAQSASTAYLSRGYREHAKRSPWVWSEIKRTARRHSEFPKFDVAANLALILTYNIIPLGLGALYSVGTVGFYAVAYRVLALPADFLGTSVGQLFFKNLSTHRDERKAALRLFRMTLTITAISATPLLVLGPFAPMAFAFVFGDAWRGAGLVALALVPHVMARLVSTPLFGIFAVYSRQRELLVSQTSLLVATLILFAIAAGAGWSATELLLTHSLVSMAIYVCTLGRAYLILSRATLEERADSPT